MQTSHKRIVILIGVIITLIAVLAACSPTTTPPQTDDTKISIAATIYPLSYIAEEIGGDLITLNSIIPQGSEAHAFEPTARTVASLNQVDLFLYNGAGIDTWAERLHPSLEAQGVHVIRMTDNVTLLNAEEHEEEDDDHGDEEEHGEFDPHIWLDPLVMQSQGRVVRDAFVKLNPENAAQYDANLTAYLQKMDSLNAEFRAGLNECELDTIVVSHNAYQYLGNRYGIDVEAISGISPEEEPSPRHLAELVQLSEEKGIKHIFFEEQTSPKFSETLAREIGAETLVLYPIETRTEEQVAADDDYIKIMQKNLENMRLALRC
ncbi:zinc ABC transporter substrate-binding lipoprotein ZnuA [Candidatus Peregrinibacteria bacterium CG11_big_fil_rev_8_21_14_0_20_46_8]|nr:MAG: zinc ABC transporter substrate-binding lipoprotein ZnuA [Candidatus Peregrinibacteria bacterium CG11_big_fil_rev_8_21_14_0_20_46_8]